MKAIEDNKKQLNNKKNNQVIMNYCFQKKEKYLRIFTTKDLIKQMKYLKKLFVMT